MLHWIKTRRHTTPPPDPERLKFEFYSTGMNYYVGARWATLAALMPAYRNQFHLAVEMFLKGALVEKGLAPDDLRQFGHNLKRLWIAPATPSWRSFWRGQLRGQLPPKCLGL